MIHLLRMTLQEREKNPNESGKGNALNVTWYGVDSLYAPIYPLTSIPFEAIWYTPGGYRSWLGSKHSSYPKQGRKTLLTRTTIDGRIRWMVRARLRIAAQSRRNPYREDRRRHLWRVFEGMAYFSSQQIYRVTLYQSPESWLKMHRGWVHPNLENQAFRRWLDWHKTLDNMEERRRIERTFDFMRNSMQLAEIYVEMVALKRLSLICSEVGCRHTYHTWMVTKSWSFRRKAHKKSKSCKKRTKDSLSFRIIGL